MFRNRFSAGAELGYAFDTHLQFFGRFTYDARKGRTRDIGTLSSPSLPAPQRLVGEFGDSDSRALEAGARYSWLASEAWRPYVALALGSTRTDEIRASLIVPNTAINLKDVRFARSGNSFSQSVETGVETRRARDSGCASASVPLTQARRRVHGTLRSRSLASTRAPMPRAVSIFRCSSPGSTGSIDPLTLRDPGRARIPRRPVSHRVHVSIWGPAFPGRELLR
ncbi:MAG: hypothetical protein WDO56_26505 [Gammaproteobacteria bacterium]